jgi:hypothetical protein
MPGDGAAKLVDAGPSEALGRFLSRAEQRVLAPASSISSDVCEVPVGFFQTIRSRLAMRLTVGSQRNEPTCPAALKRLVSASELAGVRTNPAVMATTSSRLIVFTIMLLSSWRRVAQPPPQPRAPIGTTGADPGGFTPPGAAPSRRSGSGRFDQERRAALVFSTRTPGVLTLRSLRR